MNQMRDDGPRPRGYAEKQTWTLPMTYHEDGSVTQGEPHEIPHWPRGNSGFILKDVRFEPAPKPLTPDEIADAYTRMRGGSALGPVSDCDTTRNEGDDHSVAGGYVDP